MIAPIRSYFTIEQTSSLPARQIHSRHKEDGQAGGRGRHVSRRVLRTGSPDIRYASVGISAALRHASCFTFHVSRFITIFLPVLLLAQDIPVFNSERAFNFLEQQCELGPRNPGSSGHRQGLQFILKTVVPLADSVIQQQFIHIDPYSGEMLTLTNVIAQFNPAMKKRIWIAAHWDTRPWADRDRDRKKRKQPILGANDGASGVAVLLELAYHLSQIYPNVGVDLVFLDGEDLGKRGDLRNFFIGSRYIAKNIPTEFPEYCILIDMVGDADLEIPKEGYSVVQAPHLVNQLWQEAEDLGLASFQNVVKHTIEDDHVILFEEGGIPAVVIIDFDYPNTTINYWHTTEDTPDKCSAESLEIVGTLLLYHIYRIE
ncbi:MAG: M28 family peptidase [Candidatus Marinimicrobia bacterium]|nr:M28 family peptidase [Candidatus Neomarinimicrobiota bacterium]